MRNASEIRKNRRRQDVPIADIDLLLLTDDYLGLDEEDQGESSKIRIDLDKKKELIRKRISEL